MKLIRFNTSTKVFKKRLYISYTLRLGTTYFVHSLLHTFENSEKL